MKGFSLPALIIGLLVITLGSYFLSNSFCGASTSGFAVKDNKWSTSSKDTYSFGVGNSALKLPDGTKRSFSEIAKYLNKNENKTLTLLGTQYAGEAKASKDLGTARAEAIRKSLVKYKAPEERIYVKSQMVNNRTNNKSVNGVDFIFGGTAGGSDASSSAAEKKSEVTDLGIGGLNHTFLISDDKVALKKTPEMKDYLAKLKGYIKENPDAKLGIIGHTDNSSGSASKDVRRSDKLVTAVRRFFRDNGISGSNIVKESRGSSDPAVDHSSADASKMNNRVVLRILE